ncbi:hypothetical protein [Streptomyces sp. NPDC002386]
MSAARRLRGGRSAAGRVAATGPSPRDGTYARRALRGDARFPLLTPPGSGRARHRGERRLLPRHRGEPGFGHCVTGDSYNGGAEFTRERIGRLMPGRLRAGGPVTSRAGVERLAADSC